MVTIRQPATKARNWQSHARTALWLFAFCTAWLYATADAMASDVFTVRALSVDATADSAAEARETALSQGQSRALEMLLRRLTIEEDWPALPQIPAGEVADLVSSIEIDNEKTSTVRYLAEITVSFERDTIRSLLQSLGLAYAETASKPVLVLPVYLGAEQTILWGDENLWAKAWQERRNHGGLVELVQPSGDATDVSQVSVGQVLQADMLRIFAIADRYGAEDALVAVVSLQSDPVTGQPIVAAKSTRLTRQSGMQTVLERWPSVVDQSIEGALADTVAQSVAGLERLWKQSHLLQFDREATIEVTVPLTGLNDWVFVRRQLSDSAAVQGSDLLSFSTGRARISLRYVGELDQLQRLLAQDDLRLDNAGDGWVLSRMTREGQPASVVQ